MKTIDISKHQGTFDAHKARAAGVDGVILRNAYAAKPDALALSWAPQCHAAGLLVGGYGFATWHYKSRNGGSVDTARALMRQQVSVWIETAKQSGCNYWFGVDQELEGGQQMGLGKHDNTVLLNEACEMLEKAGLHACVYCSVAWDANYIRTAELRYPYWMARYHDGDADFADPGADIRRLPAGQYTDFMQRMLADHRLAGWQFGSTGHGRQYGAGSANIDRNIFYLDVPKGDGKEKHMEFVSITGMLEVTSAENPACQAFAAPAIDAQAANLALGKYPIVAQGDTTTLAGMTATWYQITGAAQPYVLALPDRCRVVDAAAEPAPQPAPAQPIVVRLEPDGTLLAKVLRAAADALDGGKAGV